MLSAGELDPTFGVGGLVLTDIGLPTNDQARAVAIALPDGKVLVVGSTDRGFAVARYNSDGNLDPSFGDQGIAVINFGGAYDTGYGVALDSQDRVVVAGTSGGDFAVARLDTSGQLDTSFDGDGRRTIDFATTADYGYGVAVDSQDQVIVAGQSYQSGTGADFAVARLLENGAHDLTFGQLGRTTTDLGSEGTPTADSGQKVTIDAEGRILVVGYSDRGPTTFYDVAIARYQA